VVALRSFAKKVAHAKIKRLLGFVAVTCFGITVYTHLFAALFFYLEYGLYFAGGLYVQHTQRDKVFA